MERTKKNNQLPLWRNKGSTHTLADGRAIENGERFRADETEIPNAFRGNKIEKVEQGEMEQEQEEPAANSLQKFHKGGGRYVVYNMNTGQQYHEGYLSGNQADALINGENIELDQEEEENEDEE